MSDDLKRKKSDYLLELALEEQLENDGEMQAYQSGNERPHEFSDEHNRKIKDILKRAEREENKKKYRRKRLQAAACIILILSVSTLTVTRVEAFRLPLIRFFSEIREKSTKLNMQGENNFNLTKNFRNMSLSIFLVGLVLMKLMKENCLFLYVILMKIKIKSISSIILTI